MLAPGTLSKLGEVYASIGCEMWPTMTTYNIPTFPSGFAMKPGGISKPLASRTTANPNVAKQPKRSKFTAPQLEFIQWAFSRGQRNKGDKITPHKAKMLMPLHDTSTGRDMFKDDAYWKVNTRLDMHGRPRCTFRRPE